MCVAHFCPLCFPKDEDVCVCVGGGGGFETHLSGPKTNLIGRQTERWTSSIQTLTFVSILNLSDSLYALLWAPNDYRDKLR